MELDHGEVFVDDLSCDDVRVHVDTQELEHCEFLGVEKDEKHAQLAHGEISAMEFDVVND